MVEKDCVNIPQSTTGAPSSNMTGTPSSNITIGDYPGGSFCWHRLPCGICRLTGMQCPKAGACESPDYPYSPITWSSITWSSTLEGNSNKVPYATNTCGEIK